MTSYSNLSNENFTGELGMAEEFDAPEARGVGVAEEALSKSPNKSHT